MFLNLVIPKVSKIINYSQIMAKGIFRAHKLSKQKSQKPGVTNYPSRSILPNSYIQDNSNEKNDVASK